MKIEIEVPEGKELDHVVWKDATKDYDFVPEKGKIYYMVDDEGHALVSTYIGSDFDKSVIYNFKDYPTIEMAEKAAKLQRRSNAIIRACLLVDPDFEPDFNNHNETKYSVGFVFGGRTPSPASCQLTDYCPAYVSTEEKAQEVIRLLNKWGVK